MNHLTAADWELIDRALFAYAISEEQGMQLSIARMKSMAKKNEQQQITELEAQSKARIDDLKEQVQNLRERIKHKPT